MIETQHSAESLDAFNSAEGRFCPIVGVDQVIVESLVIPLPMIVNGVFASGLSQRPFAEEDHSIETLILDRPDESLGVGIQVGRAVWQAHDFDTGILQEIPERLGELGIPIKDEEPFLSEKSI